MLQPASTKRSFSFLLCLKTCFQEAPEGSETIDGAHLHDGQVTVNTYAGQEQDAAVHVDEVAEDVQVGAGEASSCTVVQKDASRQREIDQEVRHCQVDGVDH